VTIDDAWATLIAEAKALDPTAVDPGCVIAANIHQSVNAAGIYSGLKGIGGGSSCNDFCADPLTITSISRGGVGRTDNPLYQMNLVCWRRGCLRADQNERHVLQL
jgi:hypothetical protein